MKGRAWENEVDIMLEREGRNGCGECGWVNDRVNGV